MSKDVFAERLARLEGALVETTENTARSAESAGNRMPEWVRNLGYPGSMVAAFLIGIITVILSRYVMFHMNGLPDPNSDADLTMLLDGALAAGIAFVFRSALLMTSKEHLACKAAGIWVALTCMHNLVHAYPAVWATGFSPEWVERTTQMTEPRSFYFSGISFEIGGPEKSDSDTGTTQKEIKINRY